MTAGSRLRDDPALAVSVAVLWLLLGLFVVYPLAMLFARVFWDQSGFTLAGIATVLTDRHQIRAFYNSLLLALLVGVLGTLLGFLFAFTATRCRLPRLLVSAIDVAVEPSLAAILKGAKIFPIDADYAGANRKKVVDRWIAEILNP